MWRSAVGEHARSVREALKLRRHIHLEPRVQGLQPAAASRRFPSYLAPAMTQLPELSLILSRQEIRKMIRQRRRALTPEQQQEMGQQAATRMMTYPPVVMAHTVAVFLSFDGELDTQPLIEQLWRAGKRVYLPVLHPFSAGNLLFLNYHPQSELVMNRLKIHEPKLDVRDVLPLSRLDVLITPWSPLMSTVSAWEWAEVFMIGPYKTGSTIKCNRWVMRMIVSWWKNSPLKSGISHCLRWLHRRKSGSGKGDTPASP